MSSVHFDVPDDALRALNLSSDALADTLRMAAAVKLYELGKLSSGSAAKLAGIPHTVFLSKLADYGVDTFTLTPEELDRESPLA